MLRGGPQAKSHGIRQGFVFCGRFDRRGGREAKSPDGWLQTLPKERPAATAAKRMMMCFREIVDLRGGREVKSNRGWLQILPLPRCFQDSHELGQGQKFACFRVEIQREGACSIDRGLD